MPKSEFDVVLMKAIQVIAGRVSAVAEIVSGQGHTRTNEILGGIVDDLAEAARSLESDNPLGDPRRLGELKYDPRLGEDVCNTQRIIDAIAERTGCNVEAVHNGTPLSSGSKQ